MGDVDERTADRVAVSHLATTYADVVSRRRWDELDELLHPEVEVELAIGGRDPIRLVGPDAFVDFVVPAVERFELFVFSVLNLRVDLTGADTAVGSLHMSEIRQAGGVFSQVYGHYADEFRRIDGRWWFAARRYRTLARTSEPGTPLEVF